MKNTSSLKYYLKYLRNRWTLGLNSCMNFSFQSFRVGKMMWMLYRFVAKLFPCWLLINFSIHSMLKLSVIYQEDDIWSCAVHAWQSGRCVLKIRNCILGSMFFLVHIVGNTLRNIKHVKDEVCVLPLPKGIWILLPQ